MATARVDRSTGAPSTEYITYADWVSQSQSGNYSTVYIYVQAINRGNTGSFSGNNGSQTGQIDGVGSGSHSGTMPSGYANGAQRWYDGPWGYNVSHDANGNLGALTARQIISGWFSYNDTGTLPAPARIPKPATAPGTPTASEILPQSIRISWTASTDNGGSAIDGYLLRYWYNSDGSGSYTDVSQTNDLSRVVSGLQPGHAYRFVVYAHNGSAGAYSPASSPLIVSTLAPARVKVGGVYKYGIPYVKVAGHYKVALPYVKVSGAYNQPA